MRGLEPTRGWAGLMVELAEALERLGPIRATFSRDHGLILDGRYGVAPREVIAAAAEVQTGALACQPC